MLGRVVVVAGPTGVGKSRIVEELMWDIPNAAISVSATTRAPRDGEVDGQDYKFLTLEEFEKAERENKFCEVTTYHGNRYGTYTADIHELLAQGKCVFMVLDIPGMLRIKQLFTQTLAIYLIPSEWKDLVLRIQNSKHQDIDLRLQRLGENAKELFKLSRFDYIVYNHTVSDCVRRMECILQTEDMRTDAVLDSSNFKALAQEALSGTCFE